MCILTQKPSQYFTDLIRHAMKANHDEYIGNRKKIRIKLHDEWKYTPIRLNNVDCFLVSKKTTCDLPQNQMNFKTSVRQLIRAQSNMSHYDIQHLVGQASDLE